MKLTDLHESLEIAVRSLSNKASDCHFDTDLGRYYMAGAAPSVMPTKDRACSNPKAFFLGLGLNYEAFFGTKPRRST